MRILLLPKTKSPGIVLFLVRGAIGLSPRRSNVTVQGPALRREWAANQLNAVAIGKGLGRRAPQGPEVFEEEGRRQRDRPALGVRLPHRRPADGGGRGAGHRLRFVLLVAAAAFRAGNG